MVNFQILPLCFSTSLPLRSRRCTSSAHKLNNCERYSSHLAHSKSSRLPAKIWLTNSVSFPSASADLLIDDDAAGDAGGNEEDDDASETLVLHDPRTNRQLNVGIEGCVVIDNVDYFVVHPIHDQVSIALVRDNNEPELVEDTDLTPQLLSTARAALANEKFELIDSAYVLTVDDDQLLDDEILNADNEDDDFADTADNIYVDVNDEEDGFEVLAEFDFQGKNFAVVRSLTTPSVLLARRNKSSGDFEAVTGDELTKLAPVIEEKMLEWPAINQF